LSKKAAYIGIFPEKESILLPENEGPGYFVMKTLLVGGKRDNKKTYEQGQDTEHLAEETKRSPREGDPVALHIGDCGPYCQLAERCLVPGTLKIRRIYPWNNDEKDQGGKENLGRDECIHRPAGGISPREVIIILVQHSDGFRDRVGSYKDPGDDTNDCGSEEIKEYQKDEINQSAKKTAAKAGKFFGFYRADPSLQERFFRDFLFLFQDSTTGMAEIS
jgi:hypothetical protein